MSSSLARAPSRRDVANAKVRYFARNPAPEGLDKNGHHSIHMPPDAKPTKEEYRQMRHNATEEHAVSIVDARTALPGGLGDWDLDIHGFCMIQAPPTVDFSDPQVVKREYYPVLLELAKRQTGATDGFMITHALRTEDKSNPTMAYARFAHADAGPGAIVEKWRRALVRRLGMPEEEARTCDICMYNIWHPWDRPAFKDPLCLLDASSMTKGQREDGAPVQTVKYNEIVAISDGIHYSLGPLHTPNDRWVFCSDQKPEEAWLFKQWDTREGVAKASYHTSFHDTFHDKDPGCPGRRSVEFRFLLTFQKKPEEKLACTPSSRL